jgi:peptidoglycan/LPS O-acetylase OafA/YrhL
VLSVLWSVAIEEQFYVLWPLCFYLVPFRKHSYIFLVTIATSVLYRAIHCGQNADLSTLGVISDMAVGGLGAHLSITWPSFLQKVETSNRWVNLSPYLVTVFFIVNKHDIFEGAFMSVAHRLVTSIFFLWIILEQNFANTSFFKMSQFTGVSRLGKYTYGLYCLHTIALLVVVTSLNKLGLNRYAWQLWLIELPLSMLLSIILSYFSYHFFEKPFLSLKEAFSIITKD